MSNAQHGETHVESPLLTIEHLNVDYQAKGFKKGFFRAVEDASFEVGAGETLGLVGESGSGKTTIGRAILGLAPVSAGKVTFEDQDISHASRRQRRKLSRDLQVVFQDPYSSLNPSMTVGDILAEPITTSEGGGSKAAKARVSELLDQVGMPSGVLDRLPREFSGGQRQRIAIARALALSPKFIVCDEPVSALDLTTQAKILDLLLTIQRDTGVSYLFVSHDLDVVHHISHRIAVIYRGQIVEQGEAEQVARRPEHPYTQKLMMASPVPDPDRQAERREARRVFMAEQAGVAS